MTKIKREAVRAAVERLNWNYGRGELVRVDMKNKVFYRRPHQCPIEKRQFKLANNTVYALRHQQKIQLPEGSVDAVQEPRVRAQADAPYQVRSVHAR